MYALCPFLVEYQRKSKEILGGVLGSPPSPSLFFPPLLVRGSAYLRGSSLALLLPESGSSDGMGFI